MTLADVAFELRQVLGREAPSESTLSRWESGTNSGWRHNLAAVVVLARIYGCRVEDFDVGLAARVAALRDALRAVDAHDPPELHYSCFLGATA